MDVLVDHSGYELRNVGDVAMLVATLDILSANLPDARLHVLTTDRERLRIFAPHAEAVSIAPARITS